jgi:hypothetical protein
MPRRFTQVAFILLAAFVGVNCSTSSANPAGSGPDCQAQPTLCPSGQTCSYTSATTLGCLSSDPGAGFGDSCVEEINHATCADGMICDATDSNGDGQCTSFCASSASCPAGYGCDSTNVSGGGLTISICRAQATTGPPSTDGGTALPNDAGGALFPDAELLIPDAALDTGPIQQ